MIPGRTVAEGGETRRHGTAYAYRQGCRCQSCRDAHAARIKAGGANERARQRHFAARVVVEGRLTTVAPQARHGERETYNRFGCRCQPCTEAHAVYSAERRRLGGAA